MPVAKRPDRSHFELERKADDRAHPHHPDDDGGTIRGWPTPPTQEVIDQYVGGYAGQGVDVLSYGLVGGQFSSHQESQ